MALRMPEASSIFNNIRFATSDSAVWTLRIARLSRFDAGRLLVVPASPLPGLTTPRGKLKNTRTGSMLFGKEIIHYPPRPGQLFRTNTATGRQIPR